MRSRGRWLGVCLLAAACCGSVALAQSSSRGGLVVWVVHPGGNAASGYGSAARNAPGYNEQTAGSFGAAASDVGTAASNVGQPSDTALISREAAVARAQAAHDSGAPRASATLHEETAGDFGQTASSVGTAAGNHGSSVSNVGLSAGDAGTAAGSYGQAAGSYGNSVSTLAQAGQPKAAEPAGGLVQLAARKFMAVHPNVRVRFVTMDVDKVAAALRANVNSRTGYPDVLVFENFPASWVGLSAELQRVADINVAERPLSGWGGNTVPGTLSGRLSVVLPQGRHLADAAAFEDFLQHEGALKASVASR